VDSQKTQSAGKKRILGVCVGCVLIVGVAIVVWSRGPKEPEYQGKNLSEWLEIGYHAEMHSEARKSAVDAVGKIGTKALPFLVEWIEYMPSAR
jgi:hypothetical protein